MEGVKLSTKEVGNKTILVGEVDTILSGTKIYEIEKRFDNEESFSSVTCTSNMYEFIGNVVAINKNKCIVRGVYYGKMVEVPNVRIVDPKINKIGQRVMGTEHISVDGKLEIVASTKPILKKNINFVNIGWRTKNSFRQLRIDIYTGESLEIK